MFRTLCSSVCLLFLLSSGALAAQYWYPSQDGLATFAYEDMWPFVGDYDVNDFVVWYRIYGVGPDDPVAGEELSALRLSLYPRARGSSVDSGFAVLLPEECLGDATVTVVPGCYGLDNEVFADTDSGAYVLIDNTRDILPGTGFTNTVMAAPTVASQEMVYRFLFSEPVDIQCVFEGLNPFLYYVDTPQREIHLPGYPPSANADESLFGTEDDGSNSPPVGPYYVTNDGLPYALDLPIAWNHPGEEIAIIEAYPNFEDWVESAGDQNRDWWRTQGTGGFVFPASGEPLIWDKEQTVLPDEGCNAGAMVTVPAGPFMQGCNPELDDCDEWYGEYESPYHEVNVPAFEIDKYQVTVGEYAECVAVGVASGGCSAPYSGGNTYNWGKADRMDHPVNGITWYQAGEYCAWAGKRLCSESEWEKAARGTDGCKYPWGNETVTCDYAVMYEGGNGCGVGTTWAVGSKPLGVSPYGAYDMAGNVWEWVEDDWHSSYNGSPGDGTPWVEDPRASYRVLRGGSFDYDFADFLRASFRSDSVPDYDDYYFGARCCRDVL